MKMKFHPISRILPPIEGEEFDALVKSIKEKGLLNPIWLHPEGSIIDGRNRYRACKKAGVAPRYQKWNGNGSVTDFVVAQNLDRRHLDSTQRALLGKKLKPLYAAEAKERQLAGLKKGKQHGIPVTQTIEQRDASKNESSAAAHAAKAARTNRQYVADLEKIEKEFPDIYAKIEAGDLELKTAKAEIKRREKEALAEKIKQEPPPALTGPFRVIAIDPPWKYEKRAEDATNRGRTPYPDMTLDEIKALPVQDLAHDDCILWLWTTNAFIRQAFECLDAWGFENKTILTWLKDRMGLGDWLRGRTEHCLMAVRGKPLVTLTNQTTALSGPLREHSRKPDEFYALVESLCPGNKLDMFHGQTRKGWQAWYPGLTRFKDGERTEANGPTSCPQAPRLTTPVVAQLRMELGTLALETAEKVRTSDFLEGDNEN